MFEQAAPSTAPGPSAALASRGSLLSVQELGPGASHGRRQAIAQGLQMLDELRTLHLDLIEGWVAEEDLRRLADSAAGARSGTDDPRLDGVLDDIRTRASVELAKLRR